MLDSQLLTSPLEPVLLDLGAQGSSGCLYITDTRGEQAEVYLRDGMIYAVYVPGRRPLLGARLMSSGELAPETLAEALEIQRTELQGWRLGELLVYLGFVDREVVESFVSEQLLDMLVDLMGWSAASWKFRKNKKARQDVAPPQSVDSLLTELGSRRVRWEVLAAQLGGPNTVPTLAAGGAPNDDVVLGPGEWAMLCKVDGERSLFTLAADCGFTVFEAAQVVHSLVAAGLVDVDLGEDSVHEAHGRVDAEPADAEPVDAEPVDAEPAADTRVPNVLGGIFDSAPPRPPRVVESEEETDNRLRRDAVAIAAEVESARQTELKRIEAERKAKRDELRTKSEAAAWADHAEWLNAERAAVEAEAWRFHKLWLAEQRAEAEDEAWADHTKWLVAQARIEVERLEAAQLAAEAEAARLAEEKAAKEEAERIEADRAAKAEAERLEMVRVAKAEAERLAKLEAERVARVEAARLAKLEAERVEAERVEAERLAEEDAARIEAERVEAERVEAERVEAERVEAERVEAERVEAEAEAARLAEEDAARIEAERVEAERAEAEQAEAERVEAERVEAERVEAEAEAARLAEEDAARIEAERVEAERAEAERVETERVETEARIEAERVETERVEAERVETEARIEAERVEAERVQAEAARLAEEDTARIEAERIEAERIEAERIETERVEAERIEAERAEMERAEAEHLAQVEAAQHAAQVEAARVEAEQRAAQAEAAQYAADAEAERVAYESELARLADEEARRVEAEQLEAMAAAFAAPAWPSEEIVNAETVHTDLILPMVESTEPSALSQLSEINFESTAAVQEAIEQETAAPVARDEEDDRREQLHQNSGGQADTAALLRELSGLFQSGNEDGRPATPPPASPTAGRPSAAAKDDKKPKRKGLFGR